MQSISEQLPQEPQEKQTEKKTEQATEHPTEQGLEMLNSMNHFQLQELLESWGNTPLDNVSIRELAAFLQDKSHETCISWLEDKVVSGESLTVKNAAILALLHNQSLLLMHHDTNEAISIDISNALQNVSAVRDKNNKEQQDDIEKFERELDALCIDNSFDEKSTPTATPH
tara:strand:+ start:1025 stop:1537 length:513 start_codon:yes stop_codon:yes gene_type:complete